MTNFDKLCELFPHALSSSIRTKYICPASLFGLTVCKQDVIEHQSTDSIENTYDIRDKGCIECAKKFWDGQYDGAETLTN